MSKFSLIQLVLLTGLYRKFSGQTASIWFWYLELHKNNGIQYSQGSPSNQCLGNQIHNVILNLSTTILYPCIHNLDSQNHFQLPFSSRGSRRSPVSRILHRSYINTFLLMVCISFMPTSSKFQTLLYFLPKTAERLSKEKFLELPYLTVSTHDWNEGDVYCSIYSVIKRMSKVLLRSCLESTGTETPISCF